MTFFIRGYKVDVAGFEQFEEDFHSATARYDAETRLAGMLETYLITNARSWEMQDLEVADPVDVKGSLRIYRFACVEPEVKEGYKCLYFRYAGFVAR